MSQMSRRQFAGRRPLQRLPRALPLALTLLLAGCGGGNGESAGAVASLQNATSGVMRSMAAMFGDTETALTPVNATASSSERGDLDARAAIDRDTNTRWGSRFTDDEWLVLDFGQSETITRVRIDWENAYASQYLLQVSGDGSTWTTIKTVAESMGGAEDFTGLAGVGRYLRVKGVKRAGQYGYSILEIQAFTGSPAAPQPQPEPEPLPVDLTKPGVTIKPVSATSSTPENGGMSAAMAIDGKPGTRWSSRPEDGAWIQFDFGSRTPIGYMKLLWEN